MEQNKEQINFETIKERRSIRSYTDEKVSREMLMKILEAGQWAPTPSNVQSWRFVVIQEAKQFGALKTLSPGFPGEATTAIAVCSDQRRMRNFGETLSPILAAEEVAMAVQNMLLMAHSLNLGSCAVASFSEAGIKELLELPDDILPILLVALGFPNERPIAPQRQDLSQITSWERYQEV